ncbi:MAG: hypothetical protein K0S56_4594 [Microvirga sp.]|jgi:hypothetical protein|nr:hypothetical protein [Microvirga sp.]
MKILTYVLSAIALMGLLAVSEAVAGKRDGLSANGRSRDGLTQNGRNRDGLTQNGSSRDGLVQSGR